MTYAEQVRERLTKAFARHVTVRETDLAYLLDVYEAARACMSALVDVLNIYGSDIKASDVDSSIEGFALLLDNPPKDTS